MRRMAPHLRSRVAVCLLALAACTDRNPAATPDAPAPRLPPSALSMVTCTAAVREGTVTCGSDGAATAPGVPGAILGGQGVYVRLRSSGASYDGVDTFRVDVTVENLTPQALGTTDGMTPSPSGVRIFFASGPTATGGTGPVAVANETGEAFFSAAGQPYFQYDGILAPGDTSAAKEWRFTLPNTVTRFSFVVYVAAPVRMEGGWMSVSPLSPSVPVGDTLRLAAALRNVAGGVVAGAPVAWTSSDTGVVRVDAQGLLTGVGAGTATVTATGGGRTARIPVQVFAWGGEVPASIDFFEIVKGSAAADGADSLVFHAWYGRRTGGAVGVSVLLLHLSGSRRACSVADPVPTDRGDRYVCTIAVDSGARGGAWQVERMTAGNRELSHAELVAAGAPAHVYIESTAQDNDPPTLDSLAILTDTVILGQDAFRMTVIARDAGVGVREAEAWISSPGNPRANLYGSADSVRADGSVVMRFRRTLPGYWRSATFSVDSLFLRDANGNERTIHRSALEGAGFRTTFTGISLAPDTVPPTITAFSFSPDTARAGVDTVRVTLSASEPAGQSGAWYLDVEFQKVDDTTQTRYCYLSSPEDLQDLTLSCPLVFAAEDAGTWRVRYVRAIDASFLARVLRTADLQAAGYPTELVVTP